MNTKKQYIAPATEVLDMEVQLMTGISGNMFEEKTLTWDNDNSTKSVSADEGW